MTNEEKSERRGEPSIFKPPFPFCQPPKVRKKHYPQRRTNVIGLTVVFEKITYNEQKKKQKIWCVM